MIATKPRRSLAPGETRAYPVLPVHDVVVFPHMIAPLFVGRKKSLLALQKAIRSDTFVLLATQKNASDDDPATEATHEIGTLASVLQLLELPDGSVKEWSKALNGRKWSSTPIAASAMRLKRLCSVTRR